ncbi:MAG: hypothetical protein IKB80_04140 [Oscillospiraceae bacterium]|nr:hypothetical protein [Oscillospiraceae bacterium]
MNRKRILKALANLLRKPLCKVLFYLAGMAFVLGLSGAFTDEQTVWNTFLNIVKSEDTLSLLFAGLVSLGALKILSWFEGYMEESMKIEDNHHKIIAQYEKHNPFSTARKKKMREKIKKETGAETVSDAQAEERIRREIAERNQSTFADKDGEFLTLSLLKNEAPKILQASGKDTAQKAKRKARWQARKLKQLVREKGTEGKEYDRACKSAARYLAGKLDLCSLNVFANISGKTKMVFDDHTEEHSLPSFVIDHADELLQAHKNSQKRNSNTVRLNDFTYDKEKDLLTLNTGRSTYYHMLITNRCMDYQFANGMSIREVYEYDDHICPIERSKFGNQIGINGLIVTSDGYVLVEKRSRKKITWKNKFAQSISLAMKLDDLEMSRWDVLEPTPEKAQEKIEGIIKKTVKGNFGLVPGDDYEVFQMEHNFLGLARDLLEGGKPNLYFFIFVNKTAKELRNILELNLEMRHPDGRYVITDSKLDSDYYLMPFDQIAINFNYCLFAKRRDILRVHRKVGKRSGCLAVAWDRARETVNRMVRPTLKRECGEALLVTLSYMELCDRWRHPREEGKKHGQ